MSWTPELRSRWPIVAGFAGAAIVLVIFAVAGPRPGDAVADAHPLGIVGFGWAFALVTITAGLAGQVLLNSQLVLRRERRLVQTAAALREATAQLELMAATDVLTGLPNRRSFSERLGVEFRRSRRYSRPLSILMIDLDRFKETNDSHGHPFGDFVLTETASSLARNVRESDLVARYGGEEFVVMLPETTVDEAVMAADKLRRAVSGREFRQGNIGVRLSISIVAAGFEGQAIDEADELVNRADRALYEAKRAGRDCVFDARKLDGGEGLTAVG